VPLERTMGMKQPVTDAGVSRHYTYKASRVLNSRARACLAWGIGSSLHL